MFSHLLHYWLLLVFLQILLSRNMVAAGNVSAIIVFGDSTVDTGNNNDVPSIIKSNFPPYGRDYYGGIPTGRFSNGRVIIDFISEAFGLPPSVPSYLGNNDTIEQLATGVCFASGGTGLDDLTAELLLAIPIGQQLEYFKEYKEKLKLSKGESVANEIIAQALYIFSIGNNDVGVNYFLLPVRRAQFTPTEYVTYLIGIADAAVRSAYEAGARKIQLIGILPVGCVPAMRTVNLEAPGQCDEAFNQLAMSYNSELQELASKLNGDLPGVLIVYADQLYSIVSNIITNPLDYGFQNVAQGCCGTGLIELSFLCALDQPLLCQDDDKYVWFDSVHPSERTHKIVANEILKTVLQVEKGFARRAESEALSNIGCDLQKTEWLSIFSIQI
ncbi:hypothetical protein ACP4OV_030402 [Aristida adscensionis]